MTDSVRDRLRESMWDAIEVAMMSGQISLPDIIAEAKEAYVEYHRQRLYEAEKEAAK